MGLGGPRVRGLLEELSWAGGALVLAGGAGQALRQRYGSVFGWIDERVAGAPGVTQPTGHLPHVPRRVSWLPSDPPLLLYPPHLHDGIEPAPVAAGGR